jgi:acetyl-CoA carboxylase biotin carboxyl carrier protein
MSFQRIKRILELMEKHNLSEVELSGLFGRVVLRRGISGQNVYMPPTNIYLPPTIGAETTTPPTTEDVGTQTKPSTEETAKKTDISSDKLKEIKSPMVGTFYRAPAPDAEPYVDVGHKVAKGQAVCIIEAMKLMNEIESDFSGTIRKIHAENAHPVEYGQVLFTVEAD